MKKLMRFCAYMIFALALSSLQSCKDDLDDFIGDLPDNITMTPYETVVLDGTTYQVTKDTHCIPAVGVWMKSSDDQIATVNRNNEIKAWHYGSCEIYIYKNQEMTDLYKTINLTVALDKKESDWFDNLPESTSVEYGTKINAWLLGASHVANAPDDPSSYYYVKLSNTSVASLEYSYSHDITFNNLGTVKVEYYTYSESPQLLKTINVTVEPNVTTTMTVGQEVNVKEFVSFNNMYNNWYVESDDSSVVEVDRRLTLTSVEMYADMLIAKKKGTAIVYVRKKYASVSGTELAIKVTVN